MRDDKEGRKKREIMDTNHEKEKSKSEIGGQERRKGEGERREKKDGDVEYWERGKDD